MVPNLIPTVFLICIGIYFKIKYEISCQLVCGQAGGARFDYLDICRVLRIKVSAHAQRHGSLFHRLVFALLSVPFLSLLLNILLHYPYEDPYYSYYSRSDWYCALGPLLFLLSRYLPRGELLAVLETPLPAPFPFFSFPFPLPLLVFSLSPFHCLSLFSFLCQSFLSSLSCSMFASSSLSFLLSPLVFLYLLLFLLPAFLPLPFALPIRQTHL